jgi:hypothetical protein
MSIHGLYYFNVRGEVGYYDTPDDPYSLCGRKSKLGLSLFGGNAGIGWHFSRGQSDRGDVKISFDRSCRALHDATRTRIIVVGEKTPLFTWPTNSAVFNEDGTLDHVVSLPDPIEHSFDGKTMERYPAEGFVHLRYEHGKVVLGVSFHFEWVQLRLYDPFTREWGEIIGVYRQ